MGSPEQISFDHLRRRIFDRYMMGPEVQSLCDTLQGRRGRGYAWDGIIRMRVD